MEEAQRDHRNAGWDVERERMRDGGRKEEEEEGTVTNE